MTYLPDLPLTLQELYCCNNQLTSLPTKLPPTLQTLHCYNNKLTSLPELPHTLQTLNCDENQLTDLPNLPDSIIHLSINNNPLKEKYPKIYNLHNTIEIITYINNCNNMRRAEAHMAIINATQPFLEHYMRRAMHPSRLAALTQNPDIDVDTFMETYVAGL